MKKRNYTKIQVLEPEIVSMQETGIQPKPKGPRKDGQPHQSEAAELKRLRMENQLLWVFLELAEWRSAGQSVN